MAWLDGLRASELPDASALILLMAVGSGAGHVGVCPDIDVCRFPGRTWFFTVNLLERRRRLLVDHIDLLRAAFHVARMARPFEVVAMVVLPDHLHCIWRLPEGDADNAARWSYIKAGFSRGRPATEWRNASRRGKRERGIWQRRFWARVIVDDDDLRSHVDYMHYNPVKHGHVVRAVDWPHSSVHRWIARGDVPSDWGVAPVREIPGRRVGLGPLE